MSQVRSWLSTPEDTSSALPAPTALHSAPGQGGRTGTGRAGSVAGDGGYCGHCSAFPLFSCRLHSRFYELAPNVVPMDYRKSPIVHVPMSLIIQMPELRVGERQVGWGSGSLPICLQEAGPQRLQLRG